MRVFFDTSVLVDLDRQREETVLLLEELTRSDAELWISTVTVSEILTGAHLRRDAERSAVRAKAVLGQFSWKDLDGETAEKTGELLAHLFRAGKAIQYPDAAIAASAITTLADHLVTENKRHFTVFPPLAGRVRSAREFRRRAKTG